MKLARLHHSSKVEPYWHVQIAVLVAVALQLGLNSKLTVGPKYLIAGFELLLIVALALFASQDHKKLHHLRRSLAIILIAIISAANIASLILVIHALFVGHQISGTELIVSALSIYLTNIIIFGLWYWELDSNGVQGQSTAAAPVDFLFPQMTLNQSLPQVANWNPTFLDYLYISITNASAFSPTDTMPLTHRAKMLMSIQSTVSLITVVLVIARAANIIGG